MKPRQPHGRYTSARPTHQYMSSYRPAPRRQVELAAPLTRRIPTKLKVAALVLLVLCMSGHTVWTQHVSAQTEAAKRIEQQQAAVRAHRQAIFASQVQSVLAAHPELTIGVAVTSTTGQTAHYGSTDSFDAASTGKLITAADFLHHVERGQSSLSMPLDGKTAGQWLKLMIIKSDDTAWSELNTYLGHDDLQAYASSIGLSEYQAIGNTATASDITGLLRRLYARNLLNNADRSLLLGYMAQANYRDFAVAAVPATDTVYHKIGIDNDAVHDALIITHGDQSFELTIFTDGQGSYNWGTRKQIMQTITTEAINAYL